MVASDAALGELWQRYLARSGKTVTVVTSQQEAAACLGAQAYAMLILDLSLRRGSPLAVADYAGFRQPELKVLCVTRSALFSDGSIFRLAANACAMVQADVRLADIDAMIDHYAVIPSAQTGPAEAEPLLQSA